MMVRAITIVGLALVLGGCHLMSGLNGYDEMAHYTQRVDTITMSAGDAKEANRVIQTNHPWPYYVWDRRIPVSAAYTQRAMERYRSGPPAPPAPTINVSIGK